jgi:hypothetical protein
MWAISAAGHVHYPKNGFLRGSLNSILAKYVSGKANVLYAQIRHFWTITRTIEQRRGTLPWV